MKRPPLLSRVSKVRRSTSGSSLRLFWSPNRQSKPKFRGVQIQDLHVVRRRYD
jgi:hypothetical protein